MGKKTHSIIIILAFFIFAPIAVVEMPDMLENVLAQQSDSNQRLSQEDTVREVYKTPEVEPRSSKEVSSQLAEEELRNSQERSNDLAEEELRNSQERSNELAEEE